jgi:UDP-glucose 4-epimerase
MRAGMEMFGTDYPTPDGTCLRDYVQVTDLARAHMAALQYLRAGGESLTCNCGYKRGYSVKEVIDTVKRVSGVDFPVKISGRRPGDPAAIVADNARAKAALGWTPAHDDLEETVRQALAWEKKLLAETATENSRLSA